MSKHTPGPWAVKYHENTDTRSVYVAGRSWESWTVCEVGHAKEDEHNARLIASAPELLNALREMEEFFRGEEHLDPATEAMFLRARVAIAKAAGGNNES